LLPQVKADTGAAIAFLSAQAYADPARFAITGFCWGGNVVWMACAEFSALKAGVAWYGRLAKPADAAGPDAERPWPIDVARRLKAPVLGIYGGQDKGIPVADVEAMRAALAQARNPTGSEIQIYPDAQHGFHADYRPSYNEAAAKDGWSRMLAWFKAHGL
jgi:carboxymethylenebutenolidase